MPTKKSLHSVEGRCKEKRRSYTDGRQRKPSQVREGKGSSLFSTVVLKHDSALHVVLESALLLMVKSSIEQRENTLRCCR